MRVAVIGANGQLGEDVAAAFRAEGDEVKSLTHQDLEIASRESVLQSLEQTRPDVVINTAAFYMVESSSIDHDVRACLFQTLQHGFPGCNFQVLVGQGFNFIAFRAERGGHVLAQLAVCTNDGYSHCPSPASIAAVPLAASSSSRRNT